MPSVDVSSVQLYFFSWQMDVQGMMGRLSLEAKPSQHDDAKCMPTGLLGMMSELCTIMLCIQHSALTSVSAPTASQGPSGPAQIAPQEQGFTLLPTRQGTIENQQQMASGW